MRASTSARLWPLHAVALCLCLALLLPIGTLLWQAYLGGLSKGSQLLLRWPFAVLLAQTLGLTLAVLGGTLALALPMAWLTTRTDLPGARWWTLLGVLPLAVPSYMMAYCYLSLGGDHGILAQLLGWKPKRLSGFWGSWWVLTLCNTPYLFLNLRAGFLFADPALEEASRSLGEGKLATFFRVVLPQLWPAIGAGCLLIGLHVLGNFEAVSMMRYKTLSWELFQVRMLDRPYAAWLSLILLGLTVLVLALEAGFLKKLQLVRVGSGAGRWVSPVRLGKWRAPGLLFLGALAGAGVLVPVGTIGYWLVTTQEKVLGKEALEELWKALGCSLQTSLPTALLATLLAIPLVWLSVRHPSPWSRWSERIGYLGYAIAPIALALSLIFAALFLAPKLHLTLSLLVFGLLLHFLAEAIGPVRSALYQTPPRLEESARSLGSSALGAFFRVTLPCLRKGLVVSGALVFLSSMKELSLHLILSPLGYSSLAMEVWDRVENVEYASAAPFALSILLCSGLFVWLLHAQQSQAQEPSDDVRP